MKNKRGLKKSIEIFDDLALKIEKLTVEINEITKERNSIKDEIANYAKFKEGDIVIRNDNVVYKIAKPEVVLDSRKILLKEDGSPVFKYNAHVAIDVFNNDFSRFSYLITEENLEPYPKREELTYKHFLGRAIIIEDCKTAIFITESANGKVKVTTTKATSKDIVTDTKLIDMEDTSIVLPEVFKVFSIAKASNQICDWTYELLNNRIDE